MLTGIIAAVAITLFAVGATSIPVGILVWRKYQWKTLPISKHQVEHCPFPLDSLDQVLNVSLVKFCKYFNLDIENFKRNMRVLKITFILSEDPGRFFENRWGKYHGSYDGRGNIFIAYLKDDAIGHTAMIYEYWRAMLQAANNPEWDRSNHSDDKWSNEWFEEIRQLREMYLSSRLQ